LNNQRIDKPLAVGASFHESLAAGWSAGYQSGGFKRRLAFFQTLLGQHVQPGEVWLDAGCGSGILARLLAGLGAEVIAVDASPSMIDRARQESGGLAGLIEYRQVASIEALDLAAQSVDKVLCSSVVEYLDEPAQALGELFRIMRPGGVLLVSVPNRLSPIRCVQQGIRNSLALLGKDCFPSLGVSKNAYSPTALRQLLSGIGFSIQRTAFFDPLLPPALSRFALGSLTVMVCQVPQ
jgi:2-polyprenyl-6-hydroxyphenyl methylase/3-demethylubiquinone-9 3-methyltransferase